MKACCYIIISFLFSSCAGTRPLLSSAPPVDEAEYYTPNANGAEASRRRLLPDPINGLGRTNDPNIRLTDIRQTSSYTVLYMTFSMGDPTGRDYSSINSTSEISIQPDAVLMTKDNPTTYKLIKATGITTSPNTMTVKGNDRVNFVLYFERLPDTTSSFAMFECKGTQFQTCWNITDMRLESAKNP